MNKSIQLHKKIDLLSFKLIALIVSLALPLVLQYIVYPLWEKKCPSSYYEVIDILQKTFMFFSFSFLYAIILIIDIVRMNKKIILFNNRLIIKYFFYVKEFDLSSLITIHFINYGDGIVLEFYNEKVSIKSEFENYKIFLEKLNDIFPSLFNKYKILENFVVEKNKLEFEFIFENKKIIVNKSKIIFINKNEKIKINFSEITQFMLKKYLFGTLIIFKEDNQLNKIYFIQKYTDYKFLLFLLNKKKEINEIKGINK